MSKRRILMIVHKMRQSAKTLANQATVELAKHGIEVIRIEDLETNPNLQFELILTLGGDGSILSAADYARRYDVPLIGINLGHIGFLAEMDPEDIGVVVEKIAKRDYTIETRATIEAEIIHETGKTESVWALNEIALIRTDNIHPAYLSVGIDNEPISTFGCDGVILATPTGSTAYSFSSGGPIVLPDVQALIMTPLAAHALFARPIVVGKKSNLQVTVLPNQWAGLEICCDGIRTIPIPENAQLKAYVGENPIRLARMNNTPFASRLVAKFNLPVQGWRKTPVEEIKFEKEILVENLTDLGQETHASKNTDNKYKPKTE